MLKCDYLFACHDITSVCDRQRTGAVDFKDVSV